MDYLQIYHQLIENRLKHPLTDTYTENHHIIPRCMGGNNSVDNLVRLSAREHYLAHRLLWKHYGTPQLAHAWFSMLRRGRGQQRIFNSRQYAVARSAHSDTMKKTMSGTSNRFYGKKHTEETKRKISEANKGRRKSTREIANWVEKVASKPKIKQHREKIGRKGMIVLQNTITGEIIRVSKDDNRVGSDDWVNPRKLTPEKKHTCKYCGIGTTKSNIVRWHDERCKHRKPL